VRRRWRWCCCPLQGPPGTDGSLSAAPWPPACQRGALLGRSQPRRTHHLLGADAVQVVSGHPVMLPQKDGDELLPGPVADTAAVLGLSSGSRWGSHRLKAHWPQLSSQPALPLHPYSQPGQLRGWSPMRQRGLGTRRSCCSQGSPGTRSHSQLGPAAGKVAHNTPAAPPVGRPCLPECRSPSPGGCLGEGSEG